jgi:hypothetical protein
MFLVGPVKLLNIQALQNITVVGMFIRGLLDYISAPALTTVGGALEIVNCTNLNSLEFPKLETVNGTFGFLIEGNPGLQNLSFPSLTFIGGDLNWIGAFDTISIPKLMNVTGAVNIQSSSSTFKCPIPELRTNGMVGGVGFICTGGVSDPLATINVTNLTADSSYRAPPGTTGIVTPPIC